MRIGLSGCVLAPNRRHVIRCNLAQSIRGQGHQRLDFTRCVDELNFKRVRVINLDDRAHVTTPQAEFGQICSQYDRVEQVDGHGSSPGIRGDKAGD